MFLLNAPNTSTYVLRSLKKADIYGTENLNISQDDLHTTTCKEYKTFDQVYEKLSHSIINTSIADNEGSIDGTIDIYLSNVK